tara:strand:+ start:441 stop:635 length:195 start_codon:yes stop_codon:yes gene_type:complete
MWDNLLGILMLACLASLIFTKVFVAQFLLALTITVMVPVLAMFFVFDVIYLIGSKWRDRIGRKT